MARPLVGAFSLLEKTVLGVSEIRNAQSRHACGIDMGFSLVEDYWGCQVTVHSVWSTFTLELIIKCVWCPVVSHLNFVSQLGLLFHPDEGGKSPKP